MKPRISKDSPVRSLSRLLLLVGMVLFTSVGLSGVAPAAAGAAQVLRPTLPWPTGNDRIGVTALHLVDRSRTDPWVPSHPVRELMVSLWYPAQRSHARPLAAWTAVVEEGVMEEESRLAPLSLHRAL